MLRPLLFLGAVSSLANPSAGITTPQRVVKPPPALLYVQPPRLRVIFGPLGPPRAKFFRVDQRGTPGRMLVQSLPRFPVPFSGITVRPKFIGGIATPARGRLLITPLPREVGPFGPRPARAPLFIRQDQRGTPGRFLLVSPPRKPYFFQAGPLTAPHFFKVDQRGAPGRFLLQPVPRQVVTFPPSVTRPVLLIKGAGRRFPGRLFRPGGLAMGSSSGAGGVPVAIPLRTPVVVAITDAGPIAVIIPSPTLDPRDA